jgi:hypothetical protein
MAQDALVDHEPLIGGADAVQGWVLSNTQLLTYSTFSKSHALRF